MSETQSIQTATVLHVDTPLSIVVTQEGSEYLKLRKLVMEAIPMLLRPETYPYAKREQLAQGFRQWLEGACFDSESESNFPEWDAENFAEENTGYEPGECLDWPEWEEG